MEGRLKSAQPGSVVDGFLIQEMVSGVEVLVGARTDPLYGPMLVLGNWGNNGRADERYISIITSCF